MAVMSFNCVCPYCPAVLEAPDEMDGQEVKCASCGGEFIAEKPKPSVLPRTGSQAPISSPPAKKPAPIGCIVFLLLFGIIYMMLTTCEPSTSSSSTGDSAREYRIKKEMERLEYERAKGVRDALEHIEAKERLRR